MMTNKRTYHGVRTCQHGSATVAVRIGVMLLAQLK